MLQAKVNKKYRLSQQYIDYLAIKPVGEYIEIKMMYNNTIVFSDGISQFTETASNLLPNLLEPATTFNTSARVAIQKQNDVIVPVAETPVVEEPVVTETPITEPIVVETPVIEEPIVVETPVDDPSNPYGNDYL